MRIFPFCNYSGLSIFHESPFFASMDKNGDEIFSFSKSVSSCWICDIEVEIVPSEFTREDVVLFTRDLMVTKGNKD